jgi:hypothetical protein
MSIPERTGYFAVQQRAGDALLGYLPESLTGPGQDAGHPGQYTRQGTRHQGLAPLGFPAPGYTIIHLAGMVTDINVCANNFPVGSIE